MTESEYLDTSFEFDAEFVEGMIVFRPLPTTPHSLMQGFLIHLLYLIAAPLGFAIMPEERTRPRERRYRVPDISVTLGVPSEKVLTNPP